MVKLNNKGFGLHIVLPILALLAVGSIGAYMTFKSSAAVPPEGWTTVKSQTGAWTILKGDQGSGFSAVVLGNGKSKYRFCILAKASSGTTNRVRMKAKRGEQNTVSAQSISSPIGTSFKTVCSVGAVYPTGYHYPLLTWYSGSAAKIYIGKVYWQKYY